MPRRRVDSRRAPAALRRRDADGAVEKVLAGGLADMIFTDPPYNVNYGATMKDKLREKARRSTTTTSAASFEQFLRDACANMLAVTKGAIYICMSSSELHTL